ncbi:MAG: hypothetical protein LV480_09370, partial [Methylacidiphilales bacterium]|nr:hypothetical protein [Candidatus Methylacidiphilales bacterium]
FCFHPLLSLILPSFFDIPLAIFSSENHGFYYIYSFLYIQLYLGNMGSFLSSWLSFIAQASYDASSLQQNCF